MMPVACIISLYRKHSGRKSLAVVAAPDGLDVTASRTGKRIFLHVVNTSRTRSLKATLQIGGMKITGGRVFEIADDPMREIDETAPELFSPTMHPLPANGRWRFPAASVTAVEVKVREDR